MHTEQDTFDRLRRIPFREMRRIIQALNHLDHGHDLPIDHPEALAENGWTRGDYFNELLRVITVIPK